MDKDKKPGEQGDPTPKPVESPATEEGEDNGGGGDTEIDKPENPGGEDTEGG